MKHLKTYEELKSEVYRRAANKLSKLGHQGRANTLKDWSYKVEKDEEMVKLEKNIQKYSPFGKFKLNVVNPETNGRISENFYLDINFDYYAFLDSVDAMKEEKSGSFIFFIGIIPETKEVMEKCESTMPEAEFGNGMYWGMALALEWSLEDDIFKFTEYSLDSYDTTLSGNVTFADRASAGRFKNLLKKICTDPNADYPSGYTDIENFFDIIENKISAEAGFSSDYGFNIEKIGEFINTMSPNEMYKSI